MHKNYLVYIEIILLYFVDKYSMCCKYSSHRFCLLALLAYRTLIFYMLLNLQSVKKVVFVIDCHPPLILYWFWSSESVTGPQGVSISGNIGEIVDHFAYCLEQVL